VRSTVSNSGLVQILQCFCFRKGFVSTFNGQAGTITALELGGMDFCIAEDKFYRLVSAMPETIQLSLGENGKLTVKSGSNKTDLNTIATRAFPDFLPKEILQYSFAPNFIEGLKRVAFSISSNATKANLMGAGVNGSHIYSADGLRISRFKIAAPVPCPLTIPADAVNHLIKLGQPEQLFHTKSQIGAWYPNHRTHYVVACIAHEFPYAAADHAYQKIAGNIAADFPPEFSYALQRVALLCAEESSEVLIENTNDGLIISTASEEGSGREVLGWAYKEPFKFAANPKLLRQAFESSNKVDLTNVVKGDKRMLLFKSDDGFEHLLALMSMKE